MLLYENLEFLRYHFAKRTFVPPLEGMRLACTDLTLCLEGEMTYIYNGKKVTLFAGDAILMPSGSYRERTFSPVSNYYASFNILTERRVDFGFEGVVRGCIGQEYEKLLVLFNEAFSSTSPRAKDKCKALFSYLFNTIAECASGRENAAVTTVQQYIRRHYAQPITLGILAKEVHLSAEYLCALFKKNTGMTVMSYLCEVRIQNAKRLIITHTLPLGEVARMCGFGDYTAFSHAFKRALALSPAAYKRSLHEKHDTTSC